MVLRFLRWLGIAAFVIGYAVLAHYTNASAHFGYLGIWVAVVPLMLIALALAWRSAQRALMLSLVILACVALWHAWPLLERHYGILYWLQHAGMQLLLLVIFGRTLLAGREPLCTRFARAVHAPIVLTPRHERYTRQVTQAWTAFFALMALTSTLLFFFGPLSVWSFFANFLTLPLVVLMFIVEYRMRHWMLPQVPPVPILDGVRAFTNSSGQSR
jgi:uncharacterized membrane protein